MSRRWDHQPQRNVADQLHRGRHLGGARRARHLIGPVLGAGLVNGAKSIFTVAMPEYWQLFLGLIFIIVTLFLPRGVMGLLRRGDR
jgi:ABC-type branched-subunit amino acid transport system permease subunit